MKITSEDLRESKIFMYFMTTIKYAAYFYKLSERDVLLIMSLHCKKRFGREGFINSERPMRWEKKRFDRLRREGFVELFIRRKHDKAIYRVSRKGNDMVNKIYRILLGEEEIKVNHKNPLRKADTYTKKMMLTSIDDMKNDYKEETKGYY